MPNKTVMHYKTCEICDIRSGRSDDGHKRIFMAKFPLNEDRCKQWVKATGKEDLVYIPIEKLHQLKHICGNHFLSKDFKKKKTQLRNNAVPSVGLSADPLADELFIGFPLHIATTDQTAPSSSTAEQVVGRSRKRKICFTTDMEADSVSNMDMDIDQHCEEKVRSSVQEKPVVPSLYLLELEEDVAPQQPVTAPQQHVTIPQTTNACCQYSKFLEQYEKFNLEPNEKNSSTEHQVKVLKHDNIVYQKRICVLLSTQEKLKLRVKQLEAKLLAESEDFITKVKRVFADVFTSNQVDMVLGDRTQLHWTDVEYAKAYKLHRLSENAYFYMRDKLNYPLPNTAPLLKWASKLFDDRPNDDDDDDEEEPPMPKPIKVVLEEIKDEYESDEKTNSTDCVSEGNTLNKNYLIKSKDTSDTKRKSEADNSDSDQSQIKIPIDTEITDENDEQDSDIYEEIDYIDDSDIVEDNNDVDDHTTIATSGIKIIDENYEQIDYIDDEDNHDVDEHMPTSVDESRSHVSKIVYYNCDSEKMTDGNDNDSDIVDNDNGSEKRDEYFKEFVG